jgi:hypothetical protein
MPYIENRGRSAVPVFTLTLSDRGGGATHVRHVAENRKIDG